MRNNTGKRLLSVVLVALLMSTMFTGAAVYAGDLKEGQKVIPVSTEADLINLWSHMSRGGNTQDSYYRVTQDIICKTVLSPPNVAFSGTFDGNGYMISLNLKSDKNCGLFTTVSKEGSVKNLTIGGKIEGAGPTGSICGVNYGSIEKCKNYATIRSGGYSAGGIAGESYGTIRECSNEGSITGLYYSDGIAATLYGTAYSCYNKGEVAGETSGGIAGVVRFNEPGSGWIVSCYNRGDVKGSGLHVGGIAGKRYVAHRLVNSYNTGNVISEGEDRDKRDDLWGVGAITGLGYYYNCYYDKETPTLSAINKRDDIIPEEKSGGLSTGALKSDATIAKLNRIELGSDYKLSDSWFREIKEWDLDQFVADESSINDGYPILRWQLSDNQAEDAITIVVKAGIMDLENGEFNPGKEVTRAEFAKIIVKLLNYEVGNAEKATFVDVSKSNKYFNEIETAAEKGIVQGIGKDQYDPDAGIKKEELIAIVVRALSEAGVDTSISEKEATTFVSKYLDGNSTAGWAIQEMGWSVKNGLTESKLLEAKKTVTGQNINRGETASIIANALKILSQN